MGSLGLPEILIIGGIIVLLFGAKKLPEIARSFGKAKTEFRKGIDEGAVADKEETPKES